MLTSNIIKLRSYIDKALKKAEHNYTDFNKNYGYDDISLSFSGTAAATAPPSVSFDKPADKIVSSDKNTITGTAVSATSVTISTITASVVLSGEGNTQTPTVSFTQGSGTVPWTLKITAAETYKTYDITITATDENNRSGSASERFTYGTTTN